VDAVRELSAYCRRHKLDPATLQRPKINADVAVDVAESGEERFCVVRDRGIGMTPEIVRDYFLRVGASYRTSAAWKQESAGDDQQSRILPATSALAHPPLFYSATN
jgi:HSP90 family molecular chaperone